MSSTGDAGGTIRRTGVAGAAILLVVVAACWAHRGRFSGRDLAAPRTPAEHIADAPCDVEGAWLVRVLDESGAAVPGATVRLLEHPYIYFRSFRDRERDRLRRRRTDERGEVRVAPRRSTPRWVFAESDGLCALDLLPSANTQRPEVLELRLDLPVHPTLSVVSRGREPIVGAWVSLDLARRTVEDDAGRSQLNEFRGRTDQRGRLTLPPLPASAIARWCRIRVGAGGFAPVERELARAEVLAGEVTVELDTARTVRAQTVDEQGRPLPQVSVLAVGGGRGVTDADGRLDAAILPQEGGTLFLYTGVRGPVIVRSPRADGPVLDLGVVPVGVDGSISGRVEWSGRKLPGVVFLSLLTTEPRACRSTRVAPDGSFTFDNVGQGPYDLECEIPNFEGALGPAARETGVMANATDVVLSLKDRCRIRVSAGEPGTDSEIWPHGPTAAATPQDGGDTVQGISSSPLLPSLALDLRPGVAHMLRVEVPGCTPHEELVPALAPGELKDILVPLRLEDDKTEE